MHGSTLCVYEMHACKLFAIYFQMFCPTVSRGSTASVGRSKNLEADFSNYKCGEEEDFDVRCFSCVLSGGFCYQVLSTAFSFFLRIR